jgi:hypothetical protein
MQFALSLPYVALTIFILPLLLKKEKLSRTRDLYRYLWWVATIVAAVTSLFNGAPKVWLWIQGMDHGIALVSVLVEAPAAFARYGTYGMNIMLSFTFLLLTKPGRRYFKIS